MTMRLNLDNLASLLAIDAFSLGAAASQAEPVEAPSFEDHLERAKQAVEASPDEQGKNDEQRSPDSPSKQPVGDRRELPADDRVKPSENSEEKRSEENATAASESAPKETGSAAQKAEDSSPEETKPPADSAGAATDEQEDAEKDEKTEELDAVVAAMAVTPLPAEPVDDKAAATTAVNQEPSPEEGVDAKKSAAKDDAPKGLTPQAETGQMLPEGGATTETEGSGETLPSDVPTPERRQPETVEKIVAKLAKKENPSEQAGNDPTLSPAQADPAEVRDKASEAASVPPSQTGEGAQAAVQAASAPSDTLEKKGGDSGGDAAQAVRVESRHNSERQRDSAADRPTSQSSAFSSDATTPNPAPAQPTVSPSSFTEPVVSAAQVRPEAVEPTTSPGEAKGDVIASVRETTGTAARAATASEGGATSETEQAERVRFVQRVAKAVESMGGRSGSIRLRLYPPELGALRVELNVNKGVMTARMEVENPEARSVLLDNLPALRERLAEHQIKVERFDVDFMDRSSGGTPQGSGEHQQPQEQFRGGSGQSTPTRGAKRTENAEATRASPSATPGRLDVTI
jgi:flagellar hook-length control protein FliK